MECQSLHPHRNKKPNAAEDFIRVAAAYELLKDPERRRTFDESAAGWKTGSYPTSFAEKFDSEAFYKTFDVLLAKHFETVRQTMMPGQSRWDGWRVQVLLTWLQNFFLHFS